MQGFPEEVSASFGKEEGVSMILVSMLSIKRKPEIDS